MRAPLSRSASCRKRSRALPSRTPATRRRPPRGKAGPRVPHRTPRPCPTPDDGKGWAEPPKDYAAWGELVYRWVQPSVERYGKAEVEQWSWELWNEPDIFYWRGTPEEHDKRYDYTAAGLSR